MKASTWIAAIAHFSLVVLFCRFAAAAPPVVAIVFPVNASFQSSGVLVEPQVTSSSPLTSVTAQVGSGPVVTIPPNDEGVVYELISYPLAGIPKGIQTLTVTATDDLGEVGTATNTIFVDQPPSVTVTQPTLLEQSVATPTLHVEADCADPDGTCVQIAVNCSNGITALSVTPRLVTLKSSRHRSRSSSKSPASRPAPASIRARTSSTRP
jgi:hypothetical protein